MACNSVPQFPVSGLGRLTPTLHGSPLSAPLFSGPRPTASRVRGFPELALKPAPHPSRGSRFVTGRGRVVRCKGSWRQTDLGSNLAPPFFNSWSPSNRQVPGPTASGLGTSWSGSGQHSERVSMDEQEFSGSGEKAT